MDPRAAQPQRKDTFDLREDLHPDDGQHLQAHADAAAMHYGIEEEEHSILEDDSEQDEGEELYEEDDMSSTLSIPNESIDFDMVYALHSFAATVEGQANVVKGDSLFLMDDSNSYWWLVRVLKTQEVGYIPAENIETPFERLARLNKHRNIDLALPTPHEQQEGLLIAQERFQNNYVSGQGVNQSNTSLPGPNHRNGNRRNIHFNTVRRHHRYVPPLRDGEIEDEDDEWNTDDFEDEDLDLASGQMYMDGIDDDDLVGVEIDDGIWDDGIIEDMQPGPVPGGLPIPDALQPGSLREQQHQQLLRAQQQQQQELFSQQQQEAQILQQEAELAQQRAEAERQQQLESARQSGSPERLVQDAPAPHAQGPRRIDPAEITETRKVTATPTIARDIDERPAGRPTLPSAIVEEERKRSREDESSDDSIKKKTKTKDKMPPPVSSATYNKPQPTRLRKERSTSSNGDTTDDDANPKKKKNSMFGGLFGRKKEKVKDNKQTSSVGSIESTESFTRDDSDRARMESGLDGTVSPTTVTAQQQQEAFNKDTTQTEQVSPATPERSGPQVSAHAHLLRQKDQQQQALYQQYLNRSPSSPPEAQPSYGLQSASAVMLSSPSNSALGPPQPRPRPGSLIITGPFAAGESQASLSVIRVFAGKHLQTEATFKTVLLNASTTSSDLVRQALQRFRLSASESDGDYYLTVKQVEGGAFAVLESDEQPLVVFETLVNETMELPKLNRNSVGSISSISSNLSMHPAIKNLHMNDFTDDSSVKFYLNRRRQDLDDSSSGHGDDDTIKADSSFTSDSDGSLGQKAPHISPSTSVDRFTASSIRFPLQVIIYAEDLPDDMQFHPTTEAIVYKSSIPDPTSPIMVSPTLRRKIFMMPKNVTVAEVTELGLERFGVQDGVVDGGDEIEDKTTKRKSGVKVRYGLAVSIDGQEREITPSSKIVDAYPFLPQYRNINPTGANKRRSFDPSLLYGSIEDIRADDPVFVIRRATSYRNSRRRSSVPLDELALSKLHRESSSSYSSASSDLQSAMDDKLKRQEIIAAQRAATRATQRAIISAQTNSVRGMDVLLPGNAMLRSSRFDTNERMRYSYVEPDGETYDISDIVEEEWRDIDTDKDLLEGVFIRNKDGIGERLDRFINKIRKGKQREKDYTSGSDGRSQTASSIRSVSPSEYSVNTETPSRSVTPGSAGFLSRMPNGVDQTTDGKLTPSRPGTVTPTASLRSLPLTTTHNRRHPSITSVISNYSDRSTPPVSLARVEEETPKVASSRRIILPRDDFGLSQMMSIIEYKASAAKPKVKEVPAPHPVDELLFGVPVDLEALHPDIREIYAPAFKQLEEIDKVLDGYFPRSLVGAF